MRQIRQIFSTVEIILATNKDLLEAPLVKRVEQQWYDSSYTLVDVMTDSSHAVQHNRHVNQLIGDIFVKMAGILKIYTEYIQNFNDALNQIQVGLTILLKSRVTILT